MSDKLNIKLDRLKRLIDTKTREQIAEALKCDTSTVTKHYNGDRRITIDYLVKYAQYFNVSTDYLLGLTDVATTDKDLQYICDYTGLNENAINKLHDISNKTILTTDENHFDYYLEDLSANEYDNYINGELDINAAYQRIQQSNFIISFVDYIAANIETILNAKALVDKTHFDYTTRHYDLTYKTMIYGNFFEAVINYIYTLENFIGIEVYQWDKPNPELHKDYYNLRKNPQSEKGENDE